MIISIEEEGEEEGEGLTDGFAAALPDDADAPPCLRDVAINSGCSAGDVSLRS